MISRKPAWRGVVFHGEVWAWPTLLWKHDDAFGAFLPLREGMTCRWRQWDAGKPVEFDPEVPGSPEEQALVREWVANNGERQGPTGEQINAIARAFHESYERQAPDHGYKTREASAVPQDNKHLMKAVIADLLLRGVIRP